MLAPPVRSAATPATSPFEDWASRRWRLVTLALWLIAGACLLWWRWHRVRYWGLADTDDNLRLQQVRDWLAGQSWSDLTQHRLGWPDGFNVHWSRLVDLPLAGLMLGLRPFVGAGWAERLATGIAPLLPLGVMMFAVAATARRLIAPGAFAVALVLLLTAQSTLGMVQPTRIDHHGWQLAFLAVLVAGLVDPARRRGGVVAGLATALSLTIGLEMIPYLALGGAAIALRWIVEPDEEDRLTGYAYALAPATALGFVLFASNANRQPVCDALSPVWLTVMLAASAAAVLVGLVTDRRPWVRLLAAGGGAVAVFAVLAVGFPQCLGQPEGASPELQRLWLDNVREAKPITRQDTVVIVGTLGLPVAGLIGLAFVGWRARRDRARLLRWLPVALSASAAFGLLFWQARAGPAAQLLAVPGAAALGWAAIGWVRRQRSPVVRLGAVAALFLLLTGTGASWVQSALAARADPPSARAQAVTRAGQRCPALSNIARLNAVPPGRVLTFVDLGPRLIVTTRHSAVAGPYHRNGQAILDVHHFFGGPLAGARAIARRRGSDYVLICPDMAESTFYRSRNPNGMYARLAAGRPPDWLVPVPLAPGSPFRMFRVRR